MSSGSPEEGAPRKDGGRLDGVGQAGLAEGAYLSTAPRLTANAVLEVHVNVKSITTLGAKGAIFRIEQQAVVFHHVIFEIIGL